MLRVPSIPLRLLLAATATVALAACQSETPTSPARELKPSLSAVTDNERLPFAFNVRGCTERVHVTGEFHVISIFNVAGNASANETDHFHINASGSGTGLTSGAEYSFKDVINLTQQWRDNERTLESDIETLTLKAGAGGQDMKLLGRFHISVNANGETTAEFDHTETICG